MYISVLHLANIPPNLFKFSLSAAKVLNCGQIYQNSFLQHIYNHVFQSSIEYRINFK